MATHRNTQRPPEVVDRITTVRLGEAQYEALRVLAFEQRRSISAQLRHIVDQALAQEKAA